MQFTVEKIAFYSSSFLKAQFAAIYHCFSKWLGTEQATSHYFDEWWPGQLKHMCANYFQRVNFPLLHVFTTSYCWCWMLCRSHTNIKDKIFEIEAGRKRSHSRYVRYTLQWSHNGRDGVLNHRLHQCLLNRLFRSRSKKTSKFRVTGRCAGNSSVTDEFPAQRASNAENVSIWWRHHDTVWSRYSTVRRI